jgi:hypothetical protein
MEAFRLNAANGHVVVQPPREDGLVLVHGCDDDGTTFEFALSGAEAKKLARALWRAGGPGKRRAKP